MMSFLQIPIVELKVVAFFPLFVLANALGMVIGSWLWYKLTGP